MQSYVALLRGINVGGNNKVDMKQLKVALDAQGLACVKTYINTGNIIFKSALEVSELERLIGTVIEREFGLKIKVLLRTLDDFETLIQQLPESWTNDQEQKSDVLFLWEDVDDSSTLNDCHIKDGIDTVLYVPGAILWNVDRDNVRKSGLQELPKSKLYKQVTIRNVNTTRKIYAMMKDM